MYADIPKSTRSAPWDGPHKRILLESEDPESTLSGSETQETRPGWTPDDMCADSTRYKGSFDDRDREGLRLLSPLFQKKQLALRRHLDSTGPDTPISSIVDSVGESWDYGDMTSQQTDAGTGLPDLRGGATGL